MIKQHWWKILAVILLLYVFIVGLLSPLSPGITSTLPSVANTGKSVILDVEGYNTFFAEGENSAWLKLDAAHELCSENITVIDNNNLKITFQLPNTLPTIDKNAPATLIVNNTTEGYAIYPDAISIRVNEDIDSTNTVEWGICENKVLTESTTFDFPFRNVLVETIRNLYFHVPFWFGMLFIFLAAAINSILYLSRSFDMKYDIRAKALVQVGLLFGIIGIVTGGIWAQYTWGAFWSFDIKQNMSAIALLIYMAYFVLRSSFDDEQQQARLSAIYNIFSCLKNEFI